MGVYRLRQDTMTQRQTDSNEPLINLPEPFRRDTHRKPVARPARVLAYYRADQGVRFRIMARPMSPHDREFGDVTTQQLTVEARDAKGRSARVVGWHMAGEDNVGVIDRLYQCALMIDRDLADALCTIRAWEPGVAGVSELGGVLVLHRMDRRSDTTTITRGMIAALARYAHQHPDHLHARRVVVNANRESPLNDQHHAGEISRLTESLGIADAFYIPWQARMADPRR